MGMAAALRGNFTVNSEARVTLTPEGRAVIDLHRFWDGLLTGTQTYRQTGNLATELRLRPEFAREKLPELKQGVGERLQDSVVLAGDGAYKQGRLSGGLIGPTGQCSPTATQRRQRESPSGRQCWRGTGWPTCFRRC